MGLWYLRDNSPILYNESNNEVYRYTAERGWILNFNPCGGVLESPRQGVEPKPRGLVQFGNRDVQINKNLIVNNIKFSDSSNSNNILELEELNVYNNNNKKINIINPLTFLSSSNIGINYGSKNDRLLSITPTGTTGILEITYNNEQLFLLGGSVLLNTSIGVGDWFKIVLLDLLQNNEGIRTEIKSIIEEG